MCTLIKGCRSSAESELVQVTPGIQEACSNTLTHKSEERWLTLTVRRISEHQRKGASWTVG